MNMASTPLDSFFDSLWSHWELEHSHPDRIIDGIGDHPTHRYNRRLATALRI
jgi:hypothetical protein